MRFAGIDCCRINNNMENIFQLTFKRMSIPNPLSAVKSTSVVLANSSTELTIGLRFGEIKCDDKVLQYICIRKKHAAHHAPAVIR